MIQEFLRCAVLTGIVCYLLSAFLIGEQLKERIKHDSTHKERVALKLKRYSIRGFLIVLIIDGFLANIVGVDNLIQIMFCLKQ